MIRYGSLFSGAGLWDLALERALPSLHCSFQVETNDDARSILAAHWPDTPRHADIATARELPAVEGLIGGIPCDGISTARTSDTRGIERGDTHLWHHAARIVSELCPRWTLWESSGKDRAWARWVPVVRRDLWTRGHASVPFRVRTRALGAAHDRERAFVISWRPPSDPDRQGEPPRAVHAALASLCSTPASVWDGRIPPRAHGRLAHGLDRRLAERIGKGVDQRAGACTARVLGSLVRALR